MKRLRVESEVHKFPDTSGDWVLKVWRKPRIGPRKLVHESRINWFLHVPESWKDMDVAYRIKPYATGNCR
jgi:hypothetical protein